MTQLVCSVYDSKTELYSIPFNAMNKGSLLRSIQEISNDPTHPIGKNPEDYTFFIIGTWDEFKGVITMYQAKESMGVAIEFHKVSPHKIETINIKDK